ncbi:MAG: type II secretion system protein [Planctomycetota bacterium]
MNPYAPERPPGRALGLRDRRGFTLAEMVVSLAVMGVLLVGMTSAVVLASKALPANRGAASATTEAARGLHQFRDELRAATELLNCAATSVTINLPDRDGDGRPQVITYAWSGSPGDPLTRTEDGGTPHDLIGAVEAFSLTFMTTASETVFPGLADWSSEVLLSSHEAAASGANFRVKSDEWPGTRLSHTPAGGGAWRLTRFLFYGRDAGGATGQNRIEMKRWDDGEARPQGAPLDQAIVEESTLGSSFDWQEAVFTGLVEWSSGEEVALVVKAATGEDSARLKYSTADDAPSVMFSTTDSGGTWSAGADGDELLHYLYGQEQVVGDDWTYTRTRVESVGVELVHADAGAVSHRLRVPLPNAPEAATDLWDADFEADPTTLDLDADGVADFLNPEGFDRSSLNGGRWEMHDNTRLSPEPHAADTPFVMDLWLEDTSDNDAGGGARVWLDRDGDNGALLIQVNLDGSGQVVAIGAYDTDGSTLIPMVDATRPAGSPVHVSLAVDTKRDTVGVRIDGEYAGGFVYPRSPESNQQLVRLFVDGSDSGVWMDHFRVAFGGSTAVTPGAYVGESLLDSASNLINGTDPSDASDSDLDSGSGSSSGGNWWDHLFGG